MQLPDEFFLIETERSPDYSSYAIYSGDQPGDPRVNFADEARFNKRVRLLRCQVTEVMEEQS